MALPFIDKVEDLKCSESNGVIRSLTRKVRVIFDKNEMTLQLRNQNILVAALNVLDGQGMLVGSRLGDIRKREDRFAPLTLVNRDAAVAEGDPCVVDVTCRYDHVMEGSSQALYNPANGLIFGKGRTSIVEKTTNFFYPYGIRDPKDPDKDKTQIVVAHTYDAYETGIAASPHNPDYPRTIVQGGEISIPYPQSNYVVQGIFPTARPARIALLIVATVNQVEWLGMPPVTWICSEAQWEVNDPSDKVLGLGKLPNYKFSFEFQYNVDTWDPAVVFIDSRTGRPPHNVRTGEFISGGGFPGTPAGPAGVLRMVLHPNGKEIPAGVWRVPALRRMNFDGFFKALFEGATPAGMN